MSRKSTVFASLISVAAAAWLFAGSPGLSGHGFGFGNDAPACSYTTGEAVDGVVPVFADCRFDVSAERVHALLRDWEGHQRYFSNLRASAVLDRYDDGVLVRQIHTASGISDREVMVRWTVEPIPHGARYVWQKAADQSRLSGERVEVAVHHGYWEVSEDGDGTRIVYHVNYLPGGSVPFFLVHWFQGSGVRNVVAELESMSEQMQVAGGPSGV